MNLRTVESLVVAVSVQLKEVKNIILIAKDNPFVHNAKTVLFQSKRPRTL